MCIVGGCSALPAGPECFSLFLVLNVVLNLEASQPGRYGTPDPMVALMG